jgi:hypothetical protein
VYQVFLTTGLLGRLGWLAGNAAEARGRAIERWADDPPTSVLTPGRPPFFYALTGPPTVLATLAAFAVGPRRAADVLSAGSTAAALATTAVLVRTVVLPLQAGTTDREAATHRWYRLNRLRMSLVLVAVGADVLVLVRT